VSHDPNVWLGTAQIVPGGPIVAGSLDTYTITYRAGRYGVDNGGTIKIAIRLACDWGRPQFSRPGAEGYTTVHTTGAARLRAFYDPKGYVRPFSNALVIEVVDESLAEGDEVVVVWGDRSQGGPGCRAQTYVDEGFEFRVLVDCFGTQQFRRLPTSPVVRIVPAPLHTLVMEGSSTVRGGERASGILRGEDKYGNHVPSPPIPAVFAAHSLDDDASPPDTARASVGDARPVRVSCAPLAAGTYRWSARDVGPAGTIVIAGLDADGRVIVTSNPIRVIESPWGLYWGDTQGQTGATVGTGSPEAFFAHARDVAGLDFVVHSANDFQITNAHFEDIRRMVRRHHEPGRFVTFLSYEWSGNTPGGGDHNIVYFSEDDAPLHRSSQWQLADGPDDGTDRYPISRLWETLRGRSDVLAIPHVGGRYSNLDFYDPAFCPVLEITSVHGRFEWFAKDALARGFRVGFVGATDDHSGRPGNSPPTAQPDLGHHGGLAAVYATANTREALWDAIRSRRCYATTGPRILLWTEMEGHPMGAECVVAHPRMLVRAVGTAPLEWIDILRDDQVVYRRDLRPPARAGARRLRVAWSGARIRGRGRPTRWEGHLRFDAGTIRHAVEWGFETPGQGITRRDDRAVWWTSTTVGDPDGIELEVDVPREAVLTFDAGPASFSVSMKELDEGPRVERVGGEDQRVVIGWVSTAPGPLTASFEWEDISPPAGVQAYWVRLLQADTHAAWSSPIYARVGPDPPGS
jgi:hypothetical protein